MPMSQSVLPLWPKQALSSIGLLYRDIQDVEIYVEDEDSEALYRELLKRTTDNKIKIKKIFCLNGRTNVVGFCRDYKDDSPALFIIDGDLDLILDEYEEKIPRLFQHDLYCMENYLFCEYAATQILIENSGKILIDDAVDYIEWQYFLDSIKSSLEELFTIFAVAKRLNPSIKTVSNGFYAVSRSEGKKSPQKICSQKTVELISKIETELELTSDIASIESIKSTVKAKVSNSEESLDYVSGKDFLIPALYFYLKGKGVKGVTMDSFKFRLARHCAVDRLGGLSEALELTAKKGIYQAV